MFILALDSIRRERSDRMSSATRAMLSRAVVAIVSAAACGETQAPQQRPPDPPASPASVPIVFEDVNVVAMTSDAIATGRTVIVSDGRIIAIGDRGTSHPSGATVINGRGRYLAPALIDMHVHIRTADV